MIHYVEFIYYFETNWLADFFYDTINRVYS